MQQGSVMSPTMYNLYINGTLQTPGMCLGLFASDTYRYATDRNEYNVQKSAARSH
jgi:hypothetical protein